MHSFFDGSGYRAPADGDCLLILAFACHDDRPPPAVASTDRWDAVVALAETDCEEWPEDLFATNLGPLARREALRAWHAAHPMAVVDVDARYVTFAYADRTEPADIPVVAHLAASLRACGRWVDQRNEEDLVLDACRADPEATRAAWATLPAAPSPAVWAAREAVWLVEREAPDVGGRFVATLLLGTQEWMAKWALDGAGVMPEMPANMPFGQVLREETQAAPPGVTEAVARCTTSAPAGPFRVPRPDVTGVVVRAADGALSLWWPDDGVLGAAGPLGPLSWWSLPPDTWQNAGSIGELARVEHCPGEFRWQASLVDPSFPAGAPGIAGIAAPSPRAATDWRIESSACGAVLAGPAVTWALGCCP